MRRDVLNVQLGAGVDTKTDPKAVDLGSLLSSQNISFITLRRLQKRNGNLVLPGIGNPWDGLAVLNAQLVAQTSTGTLYTVTVDAGGSTWNVGTMQPMDIDSNTVQSSGAADFILSATASALVAAPNPALPTPQGIQVTAWEASTGGLYWQITDLYSGTLIVNPTRLSATGISPRCISANNAVTIFWIDTSGGGVMRATTFPASNPLVAPTTYALSATAPDLANPIYDVVYAADTNRFWICFKANGHAIPYVGSNNANTFAVVTAAIATPGITDNLMTPGTILLAYIANVLYAFTVGSTGANTQRLNYTALNNTPASLTNGTSANVASNGATGAGPLTWAYGTVAGNTNWNLLLQTADLTTALKIVTWQFTAAGVASAFTNAGAIVATQLGMHLVSGFQQLNPAINQSYGVVCWESPQQATYFVVDQSLRLHGKFMAGTAGSAPDAVRNRLTDFAANANDSGLYNLAVSVQAEVTAVNGAILTRNGVQFVTIDFTPEPAMLGAQLGQDVHLTGGQLWNFDGENLTEHGFPIYPEWLAAAGSQFDAPTFGLSMSQPAANVAGTVNWQIQCPAASLIKNGAYIQIGSSFPGVDPFFIILGIGSLPTVPSFITGASFRVILGAKDSASTVAQKIFQAIGPTPFGVSGTFAPTFIFASLIQGQGTIDLTAPMPANNGSLFGPIKNNQELAIAQVKPGAGGAKQAVALFCPAAQYLAAGQYFVLQGNTGVGGLPSTMPVWFQIAGLGSAPVASGANVAALQITLAGTETEVQVATAINTAINAAAGAQAIFTSAISATYTQSLILTDAVNGTGALGGWNFSAGGNLARNQGTTTPAVYGYAFTYRWVDNAGQTHQSAPSPIVSVPIGPGLLGLPALPPVGPNVSCGSALIQIPTLRISNKTGVTIDVWRTVANGSILMRVTTTANGLANNPGVDFITYQDTLSDDALVGNDLLYTTGILPNVGPPGSCKGITKFQNRLVLVGQEDGKLVSFSQAFVPGGAIMFNGGLTFRMDQFAGDVTAAAQLDSNLILFSETQMAYINGQGPDPLGNGAFSVPQLIEGSVGCLGPGLVAKCQLGLVFVSEKGIYLLDRSLTVNYIGAPAESLISGPAGSPGATVTAVLSVDNQDEVRFYTSSGYTVVWDYFVDPEDPTSWVGKWTSHTPQNGIAAVNWQGLAVFADSVLQSLMMENPGSYQDGATPFTYQWELSWVDETAKRQGFQRVFQALLQGIFQVGQALTIDFQYDNDTSYTDTITWTPVIDGDGNSYGGSVYGANTYGGQTTTPQPITSARLNPPRHRCSQIKIRVTEATPSNQQLSCTAITFEIGTGEGTWRKGTNLAG